MSEPDSVPPAGEPIHSVTDFNRRVKELLTRELGTLWVRGEVSNLRVQASGHQYFSLKDAEGQVAAVMFRGVALKQTFALRDGQQVIVLGEVSVYEPRGTYQLMVRAVIEDGVGRLQREFEALKARLASEGLFAPERKKAIPPMPRTVGFITSPTGAAVQDFCRILVRRGWTGRLLILPAKVQGAGAAEEVAGWLDFAGRSGKFELLVVGRGGGSLEDLWAFNEEVLVRAVAACPVPVISAVGHEIDFTLCDFAADLRAETPSAAAELISSAFVARRERWERARRELHLTVQRQGAQARQRWQALATRLRLLSPQARIERAQLRLDDLTNRLDAAVDRREQLLRERWQKVETRFRQSHPERRVEFASHQLLGLWKRLQAASPRSILQRGYAIVRDAEGQPLTSVGQVVQRRPRSLEFADGQVSLGEE